MTFGLTIYHSETGAATMIKKTEELKREMYRSLSDAKRWGCTTQSAEVTLRVFETKLEAYLEEMRLELKGSERLADIKCEEVCDLIDERDDLRNRLQAFEFANKSAGELLRDALATVKRQREFIRTLYTSRKARKSKGSTSAQSSAENVAQVKCGGKSDVLRVVSESRPVFPIVCHAEFDDLVRTTCTACSRTTEVLK